MKRFLIILTLLAAVGIFGQRLSSTEKKIPKAIEYDAGRTKMHDILEKTLSGTTATIRFTEGYQAMASTERNLQLLSLLYRLSRDLGQGAVETRDQGCRGLADIAFIAEYVDGMDGPGTMDSGAHTPKETVNLTTFEDLIKRTAIFLYRLIND